MAGHLWKAGRGNHRTYPRGTVFLVNPGQGWSAMIHDLSHAAHSRLCGRISQYIYDKDRRRVLVMSAAMQDDYKNVRRKPHSSSHASIERDMIRMVIENGWQDGTLRPKPKAAKPKPSVVEVNEAKVDTALARWEAKLKQATQAAERATARLKELRRKKARYTKKKGG